MRSTDVFDDVSDAAAEALRAFEANDLDADISIDDVKLVTFNRIQRNFVAVFYCVKQPYYEVAVQKQGNQMKIQIWHMITQQTYTRDTPIPGL